MGFLIILHFRVVWGALQKKAVVFTGLDQRGLQVILAELLLIEGRTLDLKKKVD